MAVDVLDENKSIKEVVKNAGAYVPKEIFATQAEKFIGSSKVETNIIGPLHEH